LMPQSAGPVPVRLEIRAGEIAVCGTRLVRIHTALADGLVGIEDLATGEHSNVLLSDLRGRPASMVEMNIDAHLEAARVSGGVPWRPCFELDALGSITSNGKLGRGT